METPTLNKKQQKSSLSSKKTRSKETIKNVLSTPYTLFWPEITPEDSNDLRQILKENLPKITERVNIPWRELKGIPKPDRKKFKEEYARNNQLSINKDERKHVIIGVNNTTKLLEKNDASVVIISGDVQPKLMVQHVIDLCVLYNVPVIIFSELRNLLREVCGVASIVLGLTKEIDSKSNLNLVRNSVTQIFKKCPIPVNHINYNRLENDIKATNDQETGQLPVTTQQSTISKEVIRESLYLKRESKDKRAFIPEFQEKPLTNNAMEVDVDGFLAFSGEPIHVVKSYKSLIVKRLRGDRNRTKRKVANLKVVTTC